MQFMALYTQSDETSYLLYELLLTESQPWSLWLACVQAFKSQQPWALGLNIPSYFIAVPLIETFPTLHAFLNIKDIRDSMTYQSWNEPHSPLHFILMSSTFSPEVCNTFSFHWSFMETLQILFFHNLAFLLFHEHFSLFLLIWLFLEASRWPPFCCIMWESNCVHKHWGGGGFTGCEQLSGSDIINTQVKWEKSVTHKYRVTWRFTHILPTCDSYKLTVCIDLSVCKCYVSCYG